MTGSGAEYGRGSGLLDRERQQLATGRTDLDLGVHGGADTAVEAGRPSAVVLFELLLRVLPVLPEPGLVQARIEVVPGQDLMLVALPGGEPGQVNALGRQHVGRRVDPALVGEVFRPAVEALPPSPGLADPPTDPPVAAGQQPFDE